MHDAHLAALCRTPLRYVCTYVCTEYVCTLGSVRGGDGWTYGVKGSEGACFDIPIVFVPGLCKKIIDQ